MNVYKIIIGLSMRCNPTSVTDIERRLSGYDAPKRPTGFIALQFARLTQPTTLKSGLQPAKRIAVLITPFVGLIRPRLN
ncbi:MAG: hypothetical protein ABL903_13105 [Methylococcales bacterium]